jgi:hypothetical protein
MMQTAVLNEATVAVLDLEPRTQALQIGQPANIAQAPTPADLLRIAMERGDGDMDRMERLMQMQERFLEMQERERQRQAELAHRRDFAAFRGENVIIPRTKSVDRGRGGSFMQAEFETVCRLLSPALSKHGFGFRHDMRFGTKNWPTPEDPNAVCGWVWVTCYLQHREGFVEKLELEGPPDNQSVNNPVQNMQSTASYLKRQSLLAITGTATGGEDDESGMKRPAQDNEKRGEFEELLAAGQTASIDGSKALTDWWGTLNNKQRTLMNREFGKLRKDAAANDRPVDHSRESGHGR